MEGNLMWLAKDTVGQLIFVCVCVLLPLKNAPYLSVKGFSTKVLIGDTIFTSPIGDGIAILRGHPSYAKV